jgi:crotonobetainyl-CoA:carnitine CoA-transferase CaiB-like acyl-CoA transferase
VNRPQLLDDVVVLDLTTIVSGGTATSLLADFGARVIKLEHPKGGDPLRAWGPSKDGVSLWWKVLSRNKQSATLNLKDLRGQELLKRLVERADVLVENFRPGILEQWNLGYDVLSDVNPRLVMVRISGFGQTGPYRDRPGFGTVAESMSGLVAITGHPDGPPVLPPLPLADEIAGLFGAMSTLMALHFRDRRGAKGQMIDISLYEPLFRLLIPYISQYTLLGDLPQRVGNRFPGAAPRNLYQTAEGEWLALSATTQRVFERLAQTMGRIDLLSDPRFADNESRVAHVEALDAIVQEWTASRPLDDLLQTLEDAGAVAGPVYDVPRILADRQYEAREDVIRVADHDLGEIPMPAVIPKFSHTPGHVAHAGPRLGEHNEAIYSDLLGLAPAQVTRLAHEGVI